MRGRLVLAAALLLCAATLCTVVAAGADGGDGDGDGDGAAIQQLTANTFEHLTQAGTGSTTGDWLVHFSLGYENNVDPSMRKVAAALRERNVIVARVNCVDTANKYFCEERFKVYQHVHTHMEMVALFSRGNMYMYSSMGTDMHTLNEQDLLDLVDNHRDADWRTAHSVASGPTPAPLTLLSPLWFYLERELTVWPHIQSHRMTALAAFAFFGVLLGIGVGLFITRWLCPSLAAPEDRPRSGKKKKKSKKGANKSKPHDD